VTYKPQSPSEKLPGLRRPSSMHIDPSISLCQACTPCHPANKKFVWSFMDSCLLLAFVQPTFSTLAYLSRDRFLENLAIKVMVIQG